MWPPNTCLSQIPRPRSQLLLPPLACLPPLLPLCTCPRSPEGARAAAEERQMRQVHTQARCIVVGWWGTCATFGKEGRGEWRGGEAPRGLNTGVVVTVSNLALPKSITKVGL